MKSYRFLWVLYLCIFVTLFPGCTNDDNQPELNSEIQILNYSVIGENFQSVYQFNYDRLLDKGELFNLTAESNINREYLTLRQVSDILTFFSFATGSFSAVQRNYLTGESTYINEFYRVSDDRSVIWGTNSEDRIFMGFYVPEGSTNYSIRTFNLVTDQELDLFLEFNVADVFEPLYFEGRLFITFLDERSDYKLAVLDVDSNTLIQSFEFGKTVPSILIDKDGNLIIASGNSEGNYELNTYDIQTLDLIQQDSFSINRYFSPGPIQSLAQIIDDKFYYLNLYAQPSSIPFGPAIYDFVSKENRIIDMISIVLQAQEELGQEIELTAFDFDEESNTFLMGYARLVDLETLEGGVLVISEKGELLKNTSLEFAPTNFVRN